MLKKSLVLIIICTLFLNIYSVQPVSAFDFVITPTAAAIAVVSTALVACGIAITTETGFVKAVE